MVSRLERLLQNRKAELAILLSLFAAGFAARIIPLLPFQHVGYDPYVHYQFQNALADGRTYIMILENKSGVNVQVYYPPLFHLTSLTLSDLLPSVNPYLIMEVIAASLNSLQVFPIYYLVKHFTIPEGALLAAVLSVTVRNDFTMLSWGGYPNAISLMLIPLLLYFVVKERPWPTLVVSVIIMLTHHLSMLMVFAILIPYFAVEWWQTKRLPRCLVAYVASGAIAIAAFYWYALLPLYNVYTKYAYIYALTTLPPGWWELFGPLLFVLAGLGLALSLGRSRLGSLRRYSLPLIWTAMPFLLANASVVGIEWHSIRWALYLAQPLAVWAGMTAPAFQKRPWLFYGVMALVAISSVMTMQSYYQDVALNSQYVY